MRARRMPLFLVVLAIVLAGCSSQSASSDDDGARAILPPDKGGIACIVIDDRFRPIPDAFILLTPLGLTTTSDSEGQCTFRDLDPGAYVIQIQVKDHEAAPRAVDVVAGEYTEVEAEARRTFGNDPYSVTTQYSVFIGCAFSTIDSTTIGNPVTGDDCLLDQSGDSSRAGFASDYLVHKENATFLVTEMKSNHKATTSNGAFKVVVRKAGVQDPRYASKFTVDGDYLRLTLKYGNISLDDTENRNVAWKNKDVIETVLFPQGGFKSETQQVLDAECSVDPTGFGCFESRGLGAQFGIKAKFVQTLFIGPPSVNIETYCVLAESCSG